MAACFPALGCFARSFARKLESYSFAYFLGVEFCMRVNEQLSRAVFERLNRQLGKLAKNSAARNVHKFRTYSRRVEALLGDLAADPSRSDQKLLKLLARLRRKAGQLRDLDVQSAALRNLKVPGSAGQKAQLMAALIEDRALRARNLGESFDRQTLGKVRKRLRRAAKSAVIPAEADPVKVATQMLLQLEKGGGPLTEKTLHQYRIVGKRARYVAELAGHDPEALRLVKRLKEMQDVIGDWHDWLKLTARAEKLFGSPSQSVLAAALRNITRAKFRHALDVLAQVRAELRAPSIPPRKSPAPARRSKSAA